MESFFRFIICLLIFASGQVKATFISELKPWQSHWRGHGSLEYDLQALISRLEQSPIGKKLVLQGEKKAREQGKKLIELLKEGEASYTDFTLIRKKVEGKIVFSKKGKIILDRHVNVQRAVYDLAHELVHFIWQKGANPYDHDHNFAVYLKSHIEGRGGEVDAFMLECRVASELHPQSWQNRYPCKHIIKNGRISRDLAMEAFYKVGRGKKFVSDYLGKAQEKFPYLSGQKPLIIAGTSQHPYPLSLLGEYEEIKKQVCAHERARIKREPASAILNQRFIKRCHY